MSTRQIEDWYAYAQVSPFGSQRDGMHAALIAWSNLQAHSRRKLDMSKYVLTFGPKTRPSAEELDAKLRRRAAISAHRHRLTQS